MTPTLELSAPHCVTTCGYYEYYGHVLDSFNCRFPHRIPGGRTD